jgi:hypothetical protein
MTEAEVPQDRLVEHGFWLLRMDFGVFDGNRRKIGARIRMGSLTQVNEENEHPTTIVNSIWRALKRRREQR